MLWVANPSEFGEKLFELKLNYILLVILLYIANMFTKAFRWYLLVNSTGVKVPFSKTFPYYVIALAFNNVTPGKIGGEPIRAYLLKKEANVSIGQGVASILTEKIMDVIVVTTMAIIGAIIILPMLSRNESIILMSILIAVIVGISIILVVLSHAGIFKRIVNMLVNMGLKRSDNSFIKKWTSALVSFVEKFKEGMSVILKARKTAGSCIALTIIIWINEAVRLFIIMLAMPDVSGVTLSAVFIATSIANILGLVLPLGSGNIFGISAVFIAVGMDPTNASMGGFLHAATSIWISIPLGVAMMLAKGVKPSKMSK
jgi:uncharacterized protein (TIRG00374 family)